jgi:hypothetical protein
MKERSNIDDMRAAVRGDLERARSRGESGTILQPNKPEPEPVLEPEPQPAAPEPVPEPEPDVEPEPQPVVAEPEPQPKSIFGSLFRRR